MGIFRANAAAPAHFAGSPLIFHALSESLTPDAGTAVRRPPSGQDYRYLVCFTCQRP